MKEIIVKNPSRIGRDTLAAAIRALGLDPTNIKSITLDADHVEVVEFTLNEHGARYVECEKCEPHRWATHTVAIPVRDSHRFATGGIINGSVTAEDIQRQINWANLGRV